MDLDCKFKATANRYCVYACLISTHSYLLFSNPRQKNLIFKTKVQKNQHQHSCHFEIPPKKQHFQQKNCIF